MHDWIRKTRCKCWESSSSMVQKNNLPKPKIGTRTAENSLSLSQVPSMKFEKSASHVEDTLLWESYSNTNQGVDRTGYHLASVSKWFNYEHRFFFPVRLIWLPAKFSQMPKCLWASRSSTQTAVCMTQIKHLFFLKWKRCSKYFIVYEFYPQRRKQNSEEC